MNKKILIAVIIAIVVIVLVAGIVYRRSKRIAQNGQAQNTYQNQSTPAGTITSPAQGSTNSANNQAAINQELNSLDQSMPSSKDLGPNPNTLAQ